MRSWGSDEFNRPTALVDPGKFALGENDGIGSPLRQKATVRTRFAAGAQGAALATFDQPRDLLLVTLRMGWVFGSLRYVKRPLDWILEQSMPVNGAAVVDQDQIAFCHVPAAAHALPFAETVQAVWSVGRARCSRSPEDRSPRSTPCSC